MGELPAAGQRGEWGQGDSYFGQPQAPQLSCSLQHRARAAAGTRVLPWVALGEAHASHGVPGTLLRPAPGKHLQAMWQCSAHPSGSVPPSWVRAEHEEEQQPGDLQPKH